MSLNLSASIHALASVLASVVNHLPIDPGDKAALSNSLTDIKDAVSDGVQAVEEIATGQVLSGVESAATAVDEAALGVSGAIKPVQDTVSASPAAIAEALAPMLFDTLPKLIGDAVAAALAPKPDPTTAA